jgi:hypothetical protein
MCSEAHNQSDHATGQHDLEIVAMLQKRDYESQREAYTQSERDSQRE